MAYRYITTGIEHKILLAKCACECLPIMLARAELWPATPCNPDALMLECQVSLKDLCNSLIFVVHFLL